MKILASTKGDFMLMGPDGAVVEPGRAHVVPWGTFWEQRISVGQVIVHGQLNESATDEGWTSALAQADVAKAKNPAKALKAVIDAFCTQFSNDLPVEEPPAAPPVPAAPPAAQEPPAAPPTE